MTSARRRPSRPTPPRTGASPPVCQLRSRVVLKFGRSLALAVPAVIALTVPATAGALCVVNPPLADTVRTTPIVVTATAEPGPTAQNGIGLLSPASFHVIAYDQGQGPSEIKVQTALTESAGVLAGLEDAINPRAGQTWRLWGTFGADGVLQTGTCLPSTLMVSGSAPTVAVGARKTPLRRASFAGVARSGALSTVTIGRGAKGLLQVPVPAANGSVSAATARSLVTVRVLRGATTTTLNARWSAGDGFLSTKLTAPAGGTSTIVVITRAASYALHLRAG